MTNVKRGMRFEHARYIIGSPKAGTARPDVCEITKVSTSSDGGAQSVYYCTETGMFMVTSHINDSVKKWLD